MIVKVRSESYKASLEVANNLTKVMVLDPKWEVVISDIRALGYYKIKQGVLQQRLSKYYSFESLQNIFEGYNNFRNKVLLCNASCGICQLSRG